MSWIKCVCLLNLAPIDMEQQVLDLLSTTLNTNSNEERNRAQVHLEQLQKQSGYCEALCRISLENAIPLDTRHLATIILRSMIEKNWGLSNNPIQQSRLKQELALQREFQETDEDGNPIDKISLGQIQINDDEKNRLRNQLVLGLNIDQMKIKVQFAIMLGVIVKYDFPHDMPNFLSYLINQIQNHTNGEQGAALCLEIIIHHDYLFDSNQMEEITKQIMPFLIQVYTNENKQYSDQIRKSMVIILYSIILWIFNHRIEKEDQTQGMMPFLQESLPFWIKKFSSDLIETSYYPLRICILQVICILIYSMPKTLIEKQYIHILLPQSWKIFHSLQSNFYDGLVVSSSLQNPSKDDIDFNYGTIYLFQNQILLLLEFFHAILESKLLSTFMLSSVTETIYVLIYYMQFTQEQLENYEFEEDQFIITEQDSKYSISSLTIRSSAAKLLSEILARHKILSDNSIIDQSLKAIEMRLHETSDISNSSNVNLWKLREATLFACSKAFRYFVKHSISFCNSLPKFIEIICKDLCSNNNLLFLQVRSSLCFAKLCKSLPEDFQIPSEYIEPFRQL